MTIKVAIFLQLHSFEKTITWGCFVFFMMSHLNGTDNIDILEKKGYGLSVG